MAESVVNETVVNLTATVNETTKNVTGKAAATPQGLVTAYSSLIIMALLPIFFGSYRSVKCLIEQKVCRFIFSVFPLAVLCYLVSHFNPYFDLCFPIIYVILSENRFWS